MIKDLIKYFLVATLLVVVQVLFSLWISHVFLLDKADCNAVGDVLYAVMLAYVFVKWQYVDLHEVIFVKNKSACIFIFSFICISSMSNVFDMVAALFNISKEDQTQMEMDVVRHPFALFTVSVIAPIIEELFFRGAILHRMLQSTKLSPWMAIFCSAVLFAAGHVYSLMIVNALFVGLLFGWLYYKTRSLLLTISLHLANNTLYSIILLTPLKDVQYAQMNTWMVVMGIVFLVALSFVCLLWLNANFKKQSVNSMINSH